VTQLEKYESLCLRIGHPPAQVALAWLLSRPGVSAVVSGPASLSQLESAVASSEVRLDQEVLAELDAIFPGYKTAPEGDGKRRNSISDQAKATDGG